MKAYSFHGQDDCFLLACLLSQCLAPFFVHNSWLIDWLSYLERGPCEFVLYQFCNKARFQAIAQFFILGLFSNNLIARIRVMFLLFWEL